MEQNSMIVLVVHTENEVLRELFLAYKSLVREAVNKEISFTQRVQIIREMNKQKAKIQALLAELHKSNVVSELQDVLYEEISDKELQGELKTGLFYKEELFNLLEENGETIPPYVSQYIQNTVNEMNSGEYLLFWYIEESEWRALLSN